MDPVSLILAAVTAGAAAAAKDTAAAAVKDAYSGLRRLLSKWFASDSSQEVVLAEAEKDPSTWEKPLAKAVEQSGAARQPEVLEAAQRLMALLDEAGAREGKYTVDLRGAQGVYVGDHGKQENKFGQPPTQP